MNIRVIENNNSFKDELKFKNKCVVCDKFFKTNKKIQFICGSCIPHETKKENEKW